VACLAKWRIFSLHMTSCLVIWEEEVQVHPDAQMPHEFITYNLAIVLCSPSARWPRCPHGPGVLCCCTAVGCGEAADHRTPSMANGPHQSVAFCPAVRSKRTCQAAVGSLPVVNLRSSPETAATTRGLSIKCTHIKPHIISRHWRRPVPWGTIGPSALAEGLTLGIWGYGEHAPRLNGRSLVVSRLVSWICRLGRRKHEDVYCGIRSGVWRWDCGVDERPF
jgi:hypothetical protein